jgi:hypothetical protein
VRRNELGFVLCAWLLATACEQAESGGDGGVSEGEGSSIPGGSDAGISGVTGGDLANISDAIITPFLHDSPTLPPLIIIPPGFTFVATCGNGSVDAGELCDPSVEPCCAADCAHFAPADAVCREANGACDVAETCSGEDAACPDDGVASAVTVCRPADGPCDVADRCDGASTECPADEVAGKSRTCRPADGACDVAERCDGTSTQCPADGFAIEKLCRSANGACDAPESCDGSGPDCPPNGFLQGTVCRVAAANGCDVEETCAGNGPTCPTDAFVADATACNGGLGQCSLGTCCPSATTASAPRGLCSLGSGDEVVFVTSGDFSADGGVAGADDLCRKTAQSANLLGPFHAWISQGPDASRAGEDASDRVGSGPYAQVDGTLVADSTGDIVAQGGLKNPISLTEWGEQRSTTVWTGTYATGTGAVNVDGTPFMCANWSIADASTYGETGSSVTNKPNWTQNATDTCDAKHALYCFADDPLAAIGTAFVTRVPTYFGDGFGNSIGSADRYCNDVAVQAKLAGTYAAWLSDAKTDARDRIPERAYQRVDGKPIASSIADLTDGAIANPIDVGEDGTLVVVSAQSPGPVITGTDASGHALHHCSGWTRSDANDATIGDAASTDGNWTAVVDSIGYCGGEVRFYCFQID